jgi:hypothetical protein
MAGPGAIGYTRRVKCPNCSTAAPEGSAECPGCGVIFAKLAEREARQKAEAAAQAALLDAPAPSRPPAWDRNRLRVAAVAIVAVWLAGMAVVVRRSLNRAKPGRAEGPRSVLFYDPKTGEPRYITIPAPHSAPAAPAQAPDRPMPKPASWDAGWIEDEKGRRR